MTLRGYRSQRLAWSIVSAVTLLVILTFLLFPVAWMARTAFKPNIEITLNQAPLGILNPSLENFRYLFTQTNFLRWMFNSTIVALVSSVFSVIVGTLAAYSLVRYTYKGGRAMGIGIFVTYLTPQTLLFIPMAIVIQQLGLTNNLLALMLVYPTIMIPFCTWLMMGYFRAVPNDMEESARVDGATRWQAFYLITLPLAVPGIVSAGIFTFTLSWSEYLYALVLISKDALQTVPVAVPNAASSGDVFMWGAFMAAALAGSLPVVLIYAFFMRYFVSGMTVGAVKG